MVIKNIDLEKEERIFDYLRTDKMFDKIWNLLCKEIYKHHEEQLNLLADKEQKIKYCESMSELEFKIWGGVKLGGIINPRLVLHSDYEDTHNRFWKKTINKLKMEEEKKS